MRNHHIIQDNVVFERILDTTLARAEGKPYSKKVLDTLDKFKAKMSDIGNQGEVEQGIFNLNKSITNDNFL